MILLADLDECTEDIHNCHGNATCMDIPGSFLCTCNSGFTGDGVTCEGTQGTMSSF